MSSISSPEKKRLFMNIIHCDVKYRSDYLHAWEKLDFPADEMKCFLVLKTLENVYNYSDTKLDMLFTNTINQQIPEAESAYVGFVSQGQLTAIVCYNYIDLILESLSSSCDQHHIGYHIGISSPFNNVNYISNNYTESLEALAQCSKINGNRIASFKKNNQDANQRVKTQINKFYFQIYQEFIDCFSMHDYEKISSIIPSLYQNISTLDPNTAFNICIDLIKSISDHFGLDTYENFHIKYRFDLFCSDDKVMHAIRTTFIDNLLRIVDILRDTKKTPEYIVERAKKMVEQNFMNPYFSLLEVSETMNLSYNYLCHIFKEYANINFSNYLTAVRMEKAVKLLTQSNRKISEIANAVGYSSSGYFITVFKKHYHLSPGDYKKKHSTPFLE